MSTYIVEEASSSFASNFVSQDCMFWKISTHFWMYLLKCMKIVDEILSNEIIIHSKMPNKKGIRHWAISKYMIPSKPVSKRMFQIVLKGY
jgi:hypothetical protein